MPVARFMVSVLFGAADVAQAVVNRLRCAHYRRDPWRDPPPAAFYLFCVRCGTPVPVDADMPYWANVAAHDWAHETADVSGA